MEKQLKKLIEAIKYKNAHPEISYTKIGEKFQVSRHSISIGIKDIEKYTFESSINPDYLYYFSQQELEMINLYCEDNGMGFSEIKQKYSACPATAGTLKRWCKILGKEPKSIHYTLHKDLNKRVFESIDTEEKAYWLGFLLTDGYVYDSNRQKQVNLCLAEKDINHLYKFLDLFGASEEEKQTMIGHHFGGAYTRDNPVCSVIICGKDLVNDLKKYNLFQRKSGIEKPYIFSNPLFEKAYIRGIFDGDGYIRSTQYGFGFVGSFEMMDYIRDFCNRTFDNSFEKVHITTHGKIFRFATNGYEKTKKFLDYIYKDASIYLDRKYNLYQELYCRDKTAELSGKAVKC